MSEKPLILLSNDDGYFAPGILALREALQGLGRLVVCCPSAEQSAQSHALTMHRPLRIRKIEEDYFAVDGTPTDSVLLGLHVILKGKTPNLLVSGINAGPNLGDDISYSGTVSAAFEGTVYNVPSIAFSLACHRPEHFDTAKKVAREISEWVLETGLPRGVTLNVNVPDIPEAQLRGRRVTVQGKRHFEDLISEIRDPHGRRFYWIGGTRVVPEQDPRSDIQALQEGFVSVTPLRLDLTAPDALEWIAPLDDERSQK